MTIPQGLKGNPAAETGPGDSLPLIDGLTLCWWLATLACLLPLWAFDYLPTQDGPSHLANARIIQHSFASHARDQEFFALRAEPLPNWTAQLVLVALFQFFHPLTAEKVLVSAHVVAFAFSFRYFASAANPSCRLAPLLALVFVFNRCFWMGFWNYCLSLDLYWFSLGWFLRRRHQFGWRQAGVLALLLLLAYFTHLLGFFLSAASIIWLALLTTRRPLGPASLALLAVFPAGLLTLDYFLSTGFVEAGAAGPLVFSPWQALLRGDFSGAAIHAVLTFEGNLFGPLVKEALPVGLLTLGLYVLLLLAPLLPRLKPVSPSPEAPRLWATLSLLGLLLLLYFVTPDHLGAEHGGYIKQRVALLLPLLLLASLREPANVGPRQLLRAAALLILVLNLANVFSYNSRENQALADFLAGRNVVGSRRVLYVIRPPRTVQSFSAPLLHAVDYYCLDSDNVNLANYQAVTRHFPVTFRNVAVEKIGPFEAFPLRDAITTVLVWDVPPHQLRQSLCGFDAIYSRGRLTIYQKK